MYVQCIYFTIFITFLNQYEIATVTNEGVKIEGPLKLETNWEVAHYVQWAKQYLLQLENVFITFLNVFIHYRGYD